MGSFNIIKYSGINQIMNNSEEIIIDTRGKARDKKGRFIKGVHYSSNTEFKKGDPPKNFGRGQFQKGHPGYLTHSNKTSFKKGQVNINKNKKGLWGSNKSSFYKGQISYWKGKKRPEISGKNHHLWKGGVTKLAAKIRKSFEYKQWRLNVFQKDNWTCQECGKRGVYLNIHHYPREFYQILENNNIKTLIGALHCKELWDIDNGVTLCRSCHEFTKPGRPKICTNVLHVAE